LRTDERSLHPIANEAGYLNHHGLTCMSNAWDDFDGLGNVHSWWYSIARCNMGRNHSMRTLPFSSRACMWHDLPRRVQLPWLLSPILIPPPYQHHLNCQAILPISCSFLRVTTFFFQRFYEATVGRLADCFCACRICSYYGNIGRNEPYHCPPARAENHVEVQG
jgi:hypothetical protein